MAAAGQAYLSLDSRALHAGSGVSSYGLVDSWASRQLAQVPVVAIMGHASGQVLRSLGSMHEMGDGSSSGGSILWLTSGLHWC